jgi:hypothetical protein
MWKNSACVDNAVDCGASGPADAAICDDCGNTASVCAGDCSFNDVDNTCRPIFSNDVRTASVHLTYTVPGAVAEPAWWFQKITPVASSSATYFCGVGNSYGYGGIQQIDGNAASDPRNGNVLFSIWDGGCDQDKNPDCDPNLLASTLICGTGVTCTDFGGEGTGRKSYFSTPAVPIPNTDYYMAVHSSPAANDRVDMTGFFYSEATGWRLLSKIDTNRSGKNWFLGGLYSFVEQWTEGNTVENRDAMYGPSFVSAETSPLSWTQIATATYDFGTPENHEHVNGYAQGDQVGIATGGDAEPVATQYQQFTYPPVSDLPPMLLDLDKRVGCINDATTAEEMDACLAEEFPCNSKESCVGCVSSDCAWAVGECVSSCDLIADASCFAREYYDEAKTSESICDGVGGDGAASKGAAALSFVTLAAAVVTSTIAMVW